MSKVKKTRPKKRRKVGFTLDSVEAHEVALVGTFNNWNPRKHPMQKTSTGAWQRNIMLPPGAYEYKFLVDGQWREDPQNDQSLQNAFGTRNSVLHVATR